MADQVNSRWGMLDQVEVVNNTKQCPYCQNYFKNLTMHKRFCKKALVRPHDTVKDEPTPEQPQDAIVSTIKHALRQHRIERFEYSVTEERGVEKIDVKVRIRMR
jgi:hypothetical protein